MLEELEASEEEDSDFVEDSLLPSEAEPVESPVEAELLAPLESVT